MRNRPVNLVSEIFCSHFQSHFEAGWPTLRTLNGVIPRVASTSTLEHLILHQQQPEVLVECEQGHMASCQPSYC